jgi:hypothetical protein
MLETRVLLLHPAISGRRRAIIDAASGEQVGFALTQPDLERGWFGSFLGPQLAIHEQEDEPLLFTMRRCVFRWTQYEVRDAEGERIGFVMGSAIRDCNRFLYATLRMRSDEGVYQCVNGATLAVMRPTAEGRELAFAKVVEMAPFAKMLLLAASLVQE